VSISAAVCCNEYIHIAQMIATVRCSVLQRVVVCCSVVGSWVMTKATTRTTIDVIQGAEDPWDALSL